MDVPTLGEHYAVTPQVEVFPSYFPLPNLGIVPINAFLLRAKQPVLVDTGLRVFQDELLAQIEEVIDLSDLRWIWLTHVDADHIGALWTLLERAPRAQVITTFLGMGKLNLLDGLDPERAYLLNPGQAIDVGDRTLTAIKPPLFDAPETTAFVDSSSGALFSADAFGALLDEPRSLAADVPASELSHGVVTWATIDSPWLPMTAERTFDEVLSRFRRLAPSAVYSSHLPPAFSMTERLLDLLRQARGAEPFVGPDQEAMSRMLGAA